MASLSDKKGHLGSILWTYCSIRIHNNPGVSRCVFETDFHSHRLEIMGCDESLNIIPKLNIFDTVRKTMGITTYAAEESMT